MNPSESSEQYLDKSASDTEAQFTDASSVHPVDEANDRAATGADSTKNEVVPVGKLRELVCRDRVTYHPEPPEITKGATKEVYVKSDDFDETSSGRKKKSKENDASGKNAAQQPYLLLGFDTEFKTPDYHVTREHITNGQAKYRVLSYQFHAKISDGAEWQGICCPEGDNRMSLGEFIVFALGVGAREHQIRNFPKQIYLVGHFTRADVPAFSDFKSIAESVSSVRGTFISIDAHTPIRIDYADGSGSTKLKVLFRDTVLLTPQTSKSLKAIGELVGVPKLTLDPDPARHKEMIKNMDRVRVENWDKFRAYAINDAVVCVRYIEKIIALYEQVTRKKKVPVTLTSIGVDLLKKCWLTAGCLPLTMVGRVQVNDGYFSQRLGRQITRYEEVYIEEVDWHEQFVTECYHGGRNEQYWFGPCFEGEWTDYDLSSAYPTAMSLIGMPKWQEIREEKDINLFTPTTLGFARISFKFPPETRHPVFPVRTSHGLIFPLSGEAYCSSPELCLARSMGAEIKLIRGVIVPTDPATPVFGSFIKECLDHRIKAGSKTLEGLFWKEISNSTYGKTAQGLREKRLFDLRDRDMKPLPPSKITNPFYASFITSFVRAVLGEILNSLPPDTCVFSCTTDGFLSNVGAGDIAKAQEGVLCKLYSDSRKKLTGTASVLEIKHVIRQPLGWRTRGQATLVQGKDSGKGDDSHIVLAKGGIFTPPEYETVEMRNNEIVNLFFTREPESMIEVHGKVGIRDIVENGADFVEKVVHKSLSMEYDWKCRPHGLGHSQQHNHLIFSTRPWDSVEQFAAIRSAWEDYTKHCRACLKTLDDYDRFTEYVDNHAFRKRDEGKYLKKVDPSKHRLRQMLCSAWQHSKAGLVHGSGGYSASGFAAALADHGIPCTRANVENGRKKPFVPRSCPANLGALQSLMALKAQDFKELVIEEFFYVGDSGAASIPKQGVNQCTFIDRCH